MAGVRRRVALASARKVAGHTQESLAAALHVDPSTVIRWEGGDQAPLPYVRPKLARLLGQSPEQLRGSVTSVESKIRQAWSMRRRCRRVPALRSSFAGFRFPPDVITLAVRWYLRYGLSYRDVEELLAERGITADHVSIFRWVQRFTPLPTQAAYPRRHRVGDRWWVDETYVKVNHKRKVETRSGGLSAKNPLQRSSTHD